MAVEQLPGRVGEFASYLNKLLTRLDPGTGWCAVFWQRDPDGMRACLDGREVPPWDVVEALLQDLAGEYGPAAAAQEGERARALHRASLTAHDSRPGSREALGDRLDVMLREQRYAADRVTELGRLLGSAPGPEEREAIRLDLAWAHDDHDRATARCAEIRGRIEELDRRARRTPAPGAPHFRDSEAGDVFRVPHRGGHPDATAGHPYDTAGHPYDRGDFQDRTGAAPGPDGHHLPGAPDTTAPGAPSPDPYAGSRTGSQGGAHSGAQAGLRAESPTEAQAEAAAPAAPASRKGAKAKRRPRGGARYAGMIDAEEAPPAAVVPEALPAPAAPRARTPRGARFAGAADIPAPASPAPGRQALDDTARREVSGTVANLVALRREHRSGEAHALLVEIAHWPAVRFPLLAAELHRAGLGADWATLLWEAASLPAAELVAAADALTAAGRTADGEQMLRQGVVRPAGEIGDAVLGLALEGREREVRALLDAYVRIRTPEEAVRSVAADPQRLAPLLLTAARGVSEQRHWDLVHALRVAGFAA
jgi:hypothetical protein